MKKLGALLAAIAIILVSAVSAFAGDVEITGISPKDGSKGNQPTNVAVKLKFSEDMRGGEEADAANKSKITISGPDAEGNEKSFDFTIVHSDKYPNELWIVLTDALTSNAEYSINVDSGIVSASGSHTSSPLTTTFKTRNTKTDSYISMAMMVLMFGFMIFMSQREGKKQMAENDAYYALAAAKKLNPYKIAKQKGISVEAAQAYCEKEKAKAQKAVDKANAEKAKAAAAKQAEMDAAAARIEAELAAAHAASVYKVKAPKSVKAAGGRIPKSVRNRAKEREEAEREAEKRRAQNAKGKKAKK